MLNVPYVEWKNQLVVFWTSSKILIPKPVELDWWRKKKLEAKI